jgi:hypothetical protein
MLLLQEMKPSLYLMPVLTLALLAILFSGQDGYAGGAMHHGLIYGIVRTANQSPDSAKRLDDMSIVVRRVVNDRMGKIVGFAAIHHGHYAVDMGDLPAGKYLVLVDPGESFYMLGERLVKYPGPSGSVKQNWTVSTEQTAIPTLD